MKKLTIMISIGFALMALFYSWAWFTFRAADARAVRASIDPAVISYERDVRTGICYSVIGIAEEWSWTGIADKADSLSHSQVECTKEVMALVPFSQRN